MKFSETYKLRKLKLLGHVIRCGEEDPMRQVTFQQNSRRDLTFGQRRIGRPKNQWTTEAKK